MSKSPPELVERFNTLAELVPEAARRLTFGFPSCTFAGNMFMGIHEDRFIVRLAPADRELIARESGANVFEPMPGKPMKEYMVIPTTVLATEDAETWVLKSFDYVRTLPPKIASPKRP